MTVLIHMMVREQPSDTPFKVALNSQHIESVNAVVNGPSYCGIRMASGTVYWATDMTLHDVSELIVEAEKKRVKFIDQALTYQARSSD
jgi:hypothetical protein